MRKLTLLILLSVLTGCTIHISPTLIGFAEGVCANNQGIEFIASDGFFSSVRCKNGAIFERKGKDV